jgi:NADH:ubiquinone oxidoreductase subunit 3 (subunit A)
MHAPESYPRRIDFFLLLFVIPILAFLISGVLAPISKGPEKLSSYESGIEPMGNAWLHSTPTPRGIRIPAIHIMVVAPFKF